MQTQGIDDKFLDQKIERTKQVMDMSRLDVEDEDVGDWHMCYWIHYKTNSTQVCGGKIFDLATVLSKIISTCIIQKVKKETHKYF